MFRRPRSRQDFEIAIVCALRIEYDAVCLVYDEFWDEEWDSYGKSTGDCNTYATGRIGNHNVVLALLPQMGKSDAAGTAAAMRSSYSRLQLVILAGICGWVPSSSVERILGDVVISNTIVPYDYGRQYPHKFVQRGFKYDIHESPSNGLRSLIAKLETEQEQEHVQHNTLTFLTQIQEKAHAKQRKTRYDYPRAADRLFKPDYEHLHRGKVKCSCRDSSPCDAAIVASCEELRCSDLVSRNRLREPMSASAIAYAPYIFVGAVGSGDTVMKSARHRDDLARDHNIIALETEGAGLSNQMPSIIVKGICDYADSHKNKTWQAYAAATSAAVVKAILARYNYTDVPQAARDTNGMLSYKGLGTNINISSLWL